AFSMKAMYRFLGPLLALSAITSTAVAQSGFEPAVIGYVTRGNSANDFDVNGYHILYTNKTKFSSHTTGQRGGPQAAGALYIGEAVTVFGKMNRSKHEIKATEVGFTALISDDLSGIAIVERVLSSVAGKLLVRADGYAIEINSASK